MMSFHSDSFNNVNTVQLLLLLRCNKSHWHCELSLTNLLYLTGLFVCTIARPVSRQPYWTSGTYQQCTSTSMRKQLAQT